MSFNPFGGLQPVEVAFSGTTDTTGKYTLTTQIRAAFWSLVKMTGFTTGNPTWLLEVGGNPDSIGQGPNTGLGPAIVGPGEKITLTVTGANAGAKIRGAFSGIQASDVASIAAQYVPTPNLISVQQSTQPIALGSFSVTQAAGTGNQTFLLPFGTLAIGIVTSDNAVGNQIIVTGVQTLATYFNNLTTLNQGYAIIPVDSLDDTSVKVQFNKTAAGTTTVFVTALLSPEAIFALLNSVQNVTLQDASGKNISATNSFGGHNDLFVSLQDAPAAPWQAPTQILEIERTTVGTSTILAGVANQKIYLFGWQLQNDGATAAGALACLQDDVRAAPANRLAFGLGTTTSGGNASGNYQGGPLPVAAGIAMQTFSMGGGSWRALVAVSQA